MKYANISHAVKSMWHSFRPYRGSLVLLTLLGLVSGLFEAVGVNAIIPVFAILTKADQPGTDVITRTITAAFGFFNLPVRLSTLLAFIAGLFVIKAAALIAFHAISVKITTDYEEQERDRLFRATFRASWPHLLRHKIGYLEQVLITDIGKGAALLRHLGGTILMATSMLMYIIAAISISWKITFATLLIGAILFIIVDPLFRMTRNASRDQGRITKEVNNIVSEHMIGAKAVKAMRVEDAVIAKAKDAFERLARVTFRVSLWSGVNNSIIEPIGIVFIVAVFAYAVRQPDFAFASFAVVLYLIQKIFSYIQIAQSRLQTISELYPYLDSSADFLEQAQKHGERNAGGESLRFTKSLEFSNVAFSYVADQPVLNNVSFSIAKGEMIGIIGPSGAGKTTVVDLFLRLFSPTAGSILVDGIDALNISQDEWRASMSYVSQDIFLLNDTIANNIRFYQPNITDEQIKIAAKQANIATFVEGLPSGYDTLVGERGVLLSGGQRQRVILARALVRKPQILILDEATSALDNESEALIQEAIENLKGKVTTIVIAHRLSTVMACDQLIALDNGKIVERGSPAELLKNKDSYFFKTHHIQSSTST